MESISYTCANQNVLLSLSCAASQLAEKPVDISVLFRPRNPFDVICHVFINLVNFSGPEHHFMMLQPFRLLDQLPSNEITGKTPIIANEKRKVGISHCPVLMSDACHIFPAIIVSLPAAWCSQLSDSFMRKGLGVDICRFAQEPWHVWPTSRNREVPWW
jgi:hypothetical protein